MRKVDNPGIAESERKGEPPPSEAGALTWQEDVRRGVTTVDGLQALPLSAREIDDARAAGKHHKVRIPKTYLDLIDWDDPEDPIRKQVIPTADELRFYGEELEDPIGDDRYSPVPRLTHRYPDRVLLFPTYQCAVYCRFCFRKESLTAMGRGFSREALAPAFNYITGHDEIQEVILTGGDPFFLSDDALEHVRRRLEEIAHVRLLRIHTRVPVALPSRVTADLVAALKGRFMVSVVTHFNHPREITAATELACQRLREAGFMLLNQTALLKGVNDDIDTLRQLCRDLVYRLGAKPYYLHHCDLVRGMSHMRTTIEHGLALARQLRGHVSGLCNPTYVLDLPGGSGKIPLGPSYVRQRDGYEWTFDTYDGKTQRYIEIVQVESE